jgi:hypothetical protein
MTPRERLLKFIDQRGESECWPWIGGMGSWGYGSFWLNGGNVNASRAAYILLVGDVGAGLVVCHRCDNPACCNPSHLFVGTQGDNVRDCQAKGRGDGHFKSTAPHPRYVAKITPEQVTEIRRLWESRAESQSSIGRRLGLSSGQVSRIARGQAWSHIK